MKIKSIFTQAGLGIALRAASVVSTFIAMPVALSALGSQKMGAWLVLLSIFQWITLFDLGVGAGARNVIAHAAALMNFTELGRAISTGWYYSFVMAISLFVALTCILFIPGVQSWLSLELFGGLKMGLSLWIVVTGACFAFVINFAQTVLAALEKPIAQSLYAFLANFIFMALLLIFSVLGAREINQLILLYIGAMLMAGLIILGYFRYLYSELWPGNFARNFFLRSKILGGGLKLFIIQLSALAIFTIDRILVSAFVSPDAVVPYDAAFRLFSLITMAHAVLMGSAWSSITQAYAINEWKWISKIMEHLAKITLLMFLGAILMAFIAKPAVIFWLGEDQVGSPSLYIFFAIATILGCWSNLFSYFLNAIGDTKVQIGSAIFSAAINIPAAYFFSVILNQGAAGVVMGTCVAMALFSVIGPFISVGRIKLGILAIDLKNA